MPDFPSHKVRPLIWVNPKNRKFLFFKDPFRAYKQNSVNENDILKAAISTPFDVFAFANMTFDQKNVAQTFHRKCSSSLKRFWFSFRLRGQYICSF